MRFVFQRSGSLIGLYIGLIFAYGSIGYFKSQFEMESVRNILLGMVTASGLLHFYYDGFIWKVREKSTRQSLGLAGGAADVSLKGSFLPSWSLHGLKWAMAFALPLGALALFQVLAPHGELERTAHIAVDLPNVSRPHADYGVALQGAGRLDEAAREFSIALRFNPKSAKAHVGLAGIALESDHLGEAVDHFVAALQAEPTNAEYHSGYAMVLERLGWIDAAAAESEAAIRLSPKSPQARYGYGAFLEKNGKLDEAIAQYRLAVTYDPNLFDAQIDLASALFERGELQESKKHFLESIRLRPGLAQPHNGLGKILMRENKTGEAIAQFEEALRLHPDFPEAEQNLRLAKENNSQTASQ